MTEKSQDRKRGYKQADMIQRQWQPAWDNVSKLFFQRSHVSVSPVISSWWLCTCNPVRTHHTQSNTNTKCHPGHQMSPLSYTDTHKIMQACRHLGLEGTGPGYTLVHSIVLLSSKHRVRQVKESSISIKAISINLLHILNCMTQMSLILTFTGDLYSSLTHYFQM